MTIIKKISLILLVILYTGAGINHFIHPGPYLLIIPPYLPYPAFINLAAGIIELVLGILLIFSQTRKFAAYGLVILLIAFLPAHVYMIQKGGCVSEALCIPLWAAWSRLIPLQFVLIGWAWWHSKTHTSKPSFAANPHII